MTKLADQDDATQGRESSAKLVPCIVITEGNCKGQIHRLDRARSYVVGRLPGVEIHVVDPGVSRRHVKLTRKPDGSVEASDMRSTNGLIINGERVERGSLREGDVISLGPDAVLRLDYKSAAELAQPPRARPPRSSPARACRRRRPAGRSRRSRTSRSAPASSRSASTSPTA